MPDQDAMTRRLRWGLLALFALMPASAMAQARSPQVEGFLAMVKRPLHYPLRPDRAEVQSDVRVGKRADGSDLVVDLYLPKRRGDDRPLPVAILLHGGLPDQAPVRPSEWRMYRDWGALLAQSGIAAVMFDHRLGYPQRRIDEAMAEIDQVMQWLQHSAAAHRLDPARTTAVAFSAGGLLIPELVRRYDEARIRGYVLYYPLLGIDADPANDAATAAKLDFADAVPLLARRGTPLLIFRSGADEIPGLLGRLDAGVAAALKADVRLELINQPDAPHGFDSLTDDARTRAAIARTLEFARTPN